MDGFKGAGVPGHKWRKARDRGRARGRVKLTQSSEEVGSEMGAGLQGEPFIERSLRINVMCNGVEGGITGEGESKRNNVKRTKANAGQVILSVTHTFDKAPKFLKELSPDRQ